MANAHAISAAPAATVTSPAPRTAGAVDACAPPFRAGRDRARPGCRLLLGAAGYSTHLQTASHSVIEKFRGHAPSLTGREPAVLRLLAAGRTNAQIAAELYISPRTARVHVSSILRKLGVSSRVQAAAIAERAGLLRAGQP